MRGPYYDKNGVKRSAWSKEEDERLRAYVERYGHTNWRQLPKHAGLSRCGKSCRLRWLNYLRPNVKHGNYTQQEDELIIKLHEQHGHKWSLIAERLPGRTDNEVKNHWHSHLKKHLEGNHGKKSEFKMKTSVTCEGEKTKYSEPENNMLGAASASSSNISESSPPIHNSSSTFTFREESVVAAWEIFEELNDFWTQPFVPENAYDRNNYYSMNYAENGAGIGEYSSFFSENAEFLCQVMQELPEDPERIYKQMSSPLHLGNRFWRGLFVNYQQDACVDCGSNQKLTSYGVSKHQNSFFISAPTSLFYQQTDRSVVCGFASRYKTEV